MADVPLVVYVVDDDPSVRESLALMLGLAGYATRVFADAESFLVTFDRAWTGCVLADLRLPGMSGIDLQARVKEMGAAIPFVIITAHGDVPTARTAFRAHAVDFLEKPFDQKQLFAAIDTAFGLEENRLIGEETQRAAAEKLDHLTPRELEVLKHVVEGLHAKEIATELRISPRTVEVHKTRIMEKLGARNVAELVRFVVAARRR